MDITKFDQYINGQEKAVDESSNEKKEAMYKEGCYYMRNAFNDFSQSYMKAIGLMMQNKAVMNPKYKKLRDSIARAYEKMDDAISKHQEAINKDNEVKMKAARG